MWQAAPGSEDWQKKPAADSSFSISGESAFLLVSPLLPHLSTMSTEGMSDLDFFLELAEYDVVRKPHSTNTIQQR